MAVPTKKLDFMTAVSCVGAVVVLLAVAAYFTTNSSLQSVELGAVGSLVAAILFAAFVDRVDSPFARLIDRLGDSVGGVQKIEADAKRRLEAGVDAVTDKYANDPGFWFDILRSATGKLDMVGHSFGGWRHDPFEQELMTHIARIIRDGGRVRIVVMNPSSARCEVATALYGKNYRETISGFVKTLPDLLKDFADSYEADRFCIHITDDVLTYMMIDAGNDIFVSPYLTATGAQHPLVVQTEKSSGFAAGYRADFEKLFLRGRSAQVD